MSPFVDPVLAASPSSVRALLWDLDPAEVRLRDHQSSIIPRLIMADEPEVITWVRRAVGDPAIREWIVATRGGGLSALDITPRAVAFHIPDEAIDWNPETGLSYATATWTDV